MSKNVMEPEGLQMTIWQCVACWIIKATCALACIRTDILLFHCGSGFMNAPQRDVIRTLPVLLSFLCSPDSAVILCC
jgi:hypothetical protein